MRVAIRLEWRLDKMSRRDWASGLGGETRERAAAAPATTMVGKLGVSKSAMGGGGDGRYGQVNCRCVGSCSATEEEWKGDGGWLWLEVLGRNWRAGPVYCKVEPSLPSQLTAQ